MSLILRDSLNARTRQSSALPIIFVFCRTIFVCSCMGSTNSPSNSKMPLMWAQPSHLSKCLRTALSFCVHACCFVRLKRVDSVFPMYFSEQPGHVYSYTIKELLSCGVLFLFEAKKNNFVDLKKTLIFTCSVELHVLIY